MNRLRVLAAAAAALTVVSVAGAVSSPVDAATARPAAPSSARAYQTSHGVRITWSDPHSSYDSLAVRYRRGTAPTRTQGKNVRVGKHATSASLTGLKPGAAYAVSIWTRKGKAVYSARTTVAFIAPRKPKAAATGAGTLKGVVKDGMGHPLKGVRLYVSGEYTTVARQVVTTASGAYSLALPAGPYDVATETSGAIGGSSDATGYQSNEFETRVRARTATTHNLTLAAGGALTGRVLDRSGAPLSGIAVYLQPVQPVAPTDAQDGDVVLSGGGIIFTVTGDDGSYRLKGVPAVASQLCFSSVDTITGAPGRYADTCRDGSVATAAKTVKSEGDTTLQPAAAGGPAPGNGKLKIAVTTSTGTQVDFAQLFVIGESDSYGYGLNAMANVSGHAVVGGLPAGLAEVCARVSSHSSKARSAAGFLSECKQTRVVANKTVAVSLVLPLGAAVSGTVVGPHGALSNVGVSLSSGNEVEPVSAADSVIIAGGGSGAITNSVGRYKLTSLPAGKYKVCAEASGVRASEPTGTLAACRAKRETATAGEIRILDLAVKAASAVAGTVRAAAGPLPKNAELAVYTDRGDIGQYTPAGVFDLGGLKAGSHRMCAGAFYVLSGVVSSACRTTVTRIGHTTKLNLTLPAAGTVVAGATYNGQPVSGADAVLLKACPHNDGGGLGYGCGPVDAFSKTTNVTEVAGANTFANGKVPLDGVPPGDYALCLLGFNAATAGADLPASGVSDTCTTGFDVHVTKGATTTQALTLAQAASVSGKVTTSSGKGIPGVRVDVSGEAVTPDQDEYSDGPSTDYAITAADGTYTVRSVTPGPQTVCFDASEAGTAKSGFKDQCVGGQPGGSGDGTPQVLLPGANTIPDQALQTGPGRSGDNAKRAATHRPHASAFPFAGDRSAPELDRPLARMGAGLRSVHDARSATAWWRTAGTRFAGLPRDPADRTAALTARRTSCTCVATR